MLHYYSHTITQQEEGLQVKQVLFRVLGFTAAKIRSAKYDSQGILLDGSRVTVGHPVLAGQLLQLLLNDTENRGEKILPNPMELVVLYEDEDLIAIDKPAGRVCHPSKGHLTDSLANGLQAYLDEKGDRDFIHLIGRLDKDTSGVVLIAKNGATADFMARKRENGELSKTYLALCGGHFTEPEGTIEIPMEEVRTESGMLLMKRGDRPAHTEYRVIQQYEDYALCQVRIGTGRMHQIRFHMSEIGHALLGDPIYGRNPGLSRPETAREETKREEMKQEETEQEETAQEEAEREKSEPKASTSEDGRIHRTALHAGELSFVHPYTKEQITITSRMPEDMRRLL